LTLLLRSEKGERVKIEFWKTVGDSYRFVFADLARFVRVSGIWLIGAMSLPILNPVILQASAILQGSLAIAFVLFLVWSTIAFSVAWHRVVLLGEVPVLRETIRLGWREAKYLICLLALCFGILLFGLLVTIALDEMLARFGGILGARYWIERFASDTPLLLLFATQAAGLLIAAILGIRLFLALPAIAIGRNDHLLRRAYRAGRTNALRLLIGSFLVAPLWVGAAVTAPFSNIPVLNNNIGEMVTMIVGFLCYYLQIALWASFLSFAYRQLMRDEISVPVQSPDNSVAPAH
jgi:hypothetical protein